MKKQDLRVSGIAGPVQIQKVAIGGFKAFPFSCRGWGSSDKGLPEGLQMAALKPPSRPKRPWREALEMSEMHGHG